MQDNINFYEILKYVSEQPVLYSSILNNDDFKKIFGSIDDLTAWVHKLIAEGMIQSKISISPQDGEDFELSLTELR